jgi:hypothetical protein
MKIVGEVPSIDPITANNAVPELTTIFYNGLADELKTNKVNAFLGHQRSYDLPTKIARMNEMAEAAADQERENQHTASIALRINRSSSSRSSSPKQPPPSSNHLQGTSFHTAVTVDDHSAHGEYADGSYENNGFFETGNPVDQGFQLPPPPNEYKTMFFSFVSTAEKALQQSSGRSTPIRCWGCQGLHEDDNHTFRDCPRQNDPAVRQNFLSNLAEYRKRVATKNPNEYKRDGFTTKHQVTPFNTIADPDTSASQRRQALDELAEIQTGHKIHCCITECQ